MVPLLYLLLEVGHIQDALSHEDQVIIYHGKEAINSLLVLAVSPLVQQDRGNWPAKSYQKVVVRKVLLLQWLSNKHHQIDQEQCHHHWQETVDPCIVRCCDRVGQ